MPTIPILFLLNIGLENADQECFGQCNGQGRCSWCGSEGYCCRKGWTPGNGCDGSFCDDNHHLCILKRTSNLDNPLSQ